MSYCTSVITCGYSPVVTKPVYMAPGLTHSCRCAVNESTSFLICSQWCLALSQKNTIGSYTPLEVRLPVLSCVLPKFCNAIFCFCLFDYKINQNIIKIDEESNFFVLVLFLFLCLYWCISFDPRHM